MSKSLRILVVDDDLDMAESLAEILIARGHVVDIAHCGTDSIRLFRSCRHDLVFMDVQMEGMNGVDAFLEIRKIEPKAKVIIMTGFGAEELLNRAENNGAMGIMHKPVNIGEVFQIIDRIRPCGLVLIAVEDNAFAARAKEALDHQGYNSIVARSSAEAEALVGRGEVDILFLDLGLGDLGSSELYNQILKLGDARPNVIVTGLCSTESAAASGLRAVCDAKLETGEPRVESLIETLRVLDDSHPTSRE